MTTLPAFAFVSFSIVLLKLSTGLIVTVIAAIILGAAATLPGLFKQRKYRKVEAKYSTYYERFKQMEADAEAKFGPSVELLRPEMQFDDDPELFDRAWKDFERHREERSRISRAES
ncbi:MAG TPA: hypothetical protein VGJ33_11080 [Candidatus Angelobacter sp.]|jgi:hypothetical protein